uniref:Uncharacterized protein n=1 Tax=viral metagenome TaxID=1070528 RepID=A0A6H1ZM67_9ZZZZ
MKNQECISLLIGMTGAIKEIREDQEYINTIKHAIKILELEEVSSAAQLRIIPGGGLGKELDCTAKECEELKELIRDILPFCRLNEAEKWVEPLLKKYGI